MNYLIVLRNDRYGFDEMGVVDKVSSVMESWFRIYNVIEMLNLSIDT